MPTKLVPCGKYLKIRLSAFSAFDHIHSSSCVAFCKQTARFWCCPSYSGGLSERILALTNFHCPSVEQETSFLTLSFTSPQSLISLTPHISPPHLATSIKDTHTHQSLESSISECVPQSIPVYTSSLANVHCSKWLVWFRISGFCDTINIASSLGLLPVTLLLPCVIEILKLWMDRTGLFTDGGDFGVGQFRALGLGPGGS